MSALSFGGIWTHPSLPFPDHAEFMSIDESRGRIIIFVVISIAPVKHAPMRHWYRAESATSFATRLRPTAPWRIQEFQLDGDRLLWTYGGGTHAWRRLLPNEQPDWLAARLATQNSEMDATDDCA